MRRIRFAAILFFVLFLPVEVRGQTKTESAFNIESSSQARENSSGCQEVSDSLVSKGEDGSETRVNRHWTTFPDGSAVFNQTAYHRDAQGRAAQETLSQTYDVAGKLTGEEWSGSDDIEPPPPGKSSQCQPEPRTEPAVSTPPPNGVPIPPLEAMEGVIALSGHSEVKGYSAPVTQGDPPWNIDMMSDKQAEIRFSLREDDSAGTEDIRYFYSVSGQLRYRVRGTNEQGDSHGHLSESWEGAENSVPLEPAAVTLIINVRAGTYVLNFSQEAVHVTTRTKMTGPMMPPSESISERKSRIGLSVAGTLKNSHPPSIEEARQWPISAFLSHTQAGVQQIPDFVNRQSISRIVSQSYEETYRFLRSSDFPPGLDHLDPAEGLVLVVGNPDWNGRLDGGGFIRAQWSLSVDR